MWLIFVLLSTFGWAMVNVMDSILVHNYEKKPMTLMWCQAMWSVPILVVLGFFIPLEAPWPWISVLLAIGLVGYLADLRFFQLLEHIDVSVTNIAWSILSIVLAITGFVLFHESWGMMQTIGAMFIVSGAFLVSFYHQHINLRHTLWMLVTLATLFAPVYIIKKAAINADILPVTVFFWMLAAREMLALVVPLFTSNVRSRGIAALKKGWSFSLINGIVIVSFLLAEYFGAVAYRLGTLSLVTIVSNIQPFIVMVLAGALSIVLPHKLPKELRTKQSVQIKVISFTIVFIGLALLTSAQ